jgi:hypothetical protein
VVANQIREAKASYIAYGPGAGSRRPFASSVSAPVSSLLPGFDVNKPAQNVRMGRTALFAGVTLDTQIGCASKT